VSDPSHVNVAGGAVVSDSTRWRTEASEGGRFVLSYMCRFSCRTAVAGVGFHVSLHPLGVFSQMLPHFSSTLPKHKEGESYVEDANEKTEAGSVSPLKRD
jgi:hypothetical protein